MIQVRDTVHCLVAEVLEVIQVRDTAHCLVAEGQNLRDSGLELKYLVCFQSNQR